jgi:hypothetical protein
VGHWVAARISPDGAWLLAQWSGECEVPAAYLVRIADGAVLAADGRPLQPPGAAEPGDSWAVTWAGDRALIAVTGGPCGGTGFESAVWSIDPARAPGPRSSPWTTTRTGSSPRPSAPGGGPTFGRRPAAAAPVPGR